MSRELTLNELFNLYWRRIINNTSSVTYLRKHALGAKLIDGLFRVMQSGEGREALLS